MLSFPCGVRLPRDQVCHSCGFGWGYEPTLKYYLEPATWVGAAAAAAGANFQPGWFRNHAMPLWRAALAVRRMVQNIKEPNKLWPPGTTVRVLSNDAEPDMVAAMVAEFADQMSKTTTASALEWTNSVLANEEAASGRVAAGRAIEVNYAGPRKVVDLKNYRQDSYIYERRNEAQRWDYLSYVIAGANSFQKPEDFIKGGMVAAVGQGSAAAVGQMAADGQLADGRFRLNICSNKAMRQPVESNMGRDSVSGTG